MDARKERNRRSASQKITGQNGNDNYEDFFSLKLKKQVTPAEKRMQRMKIQAILTSNERNLAANVQSLQEGEAHA